MYEQSRLLFMHGAYLKQTLPPYILPSVNVQSALSCGCQTHSVDYSAAVHVHST